MNATKRAFDVDFAEARLLDLTTTAGHVDGPLEALTLPGDHGDRFAKNLIITLPTVTVIDVDECRSISAIEEGSGEYIIQSTWPESLNAGLLRVIDPPLVLAIEILEGCEGRFHELHQGISVEGRVNGSAQEADEEKALQHGDSSGRGNPVVVARQRASPHEGGTSQDSRPVNYFPFI